MNGPLSPRRVWLLAAVALLLTFVAGSLAGAAWERYHRPQERRHEGGRRHFGEMLKRRYDLSDDQARRIEAIVQRRRPRVDSLMATVQPRIRAAFDTTNAEIRLVLTPGQRVKFDRDQRERRQREAARQSTPPPPGPGSPP